MLATSPMIAIELGRKRHSVRDVRRTVRQGLWLAVLVCDPDLAVPLACRVDPALDGAGPGAGARRPAPMCVRCNGPRCPSTATSCCAPSSRRWSGRAGRWSSCSFAVALQRRRQLVPDVRPSRLSGAGHCRARAGDDAVQLLMFLGLATVVSLDRRSAAIACSAGSGGPTGRASARSGGSACRSRHCSPSRSSIFNAAAFLMGLIGADLARRPRHRDPDRLALLHGAAGPRPGGDGARRPRFRRAAIRKASAAPAGPPSRSASASWR